MTCVNVTHNFKNCLLAELSFVEFCWECRKNKEILSEMNKNSKNVREITLKDLRDKDHPTWDDV